ncbi:MAG TPA: hypothetical protein VMV94_18410 [Phycisphaerae bacterium]|nr:hypothetical protein [Phycisphaerae bacterium]
MASHPGIRYVGDAFGVALYSRFKDEIPSLAEAAQCPGDYRFDRFVHFEGEAERRFREFARRVVTAKIHIYPMLHFWEPYFHRITDRVVFQMPTATAMIEWFAEQFPVDIVLLLRHPIANALSSIAANHPEECGAYLNHRWFVDTHLTGSQVDLARRILASGSLLAVHVLDWVLTLLAPIRALESRTHPDWLTITYEQTVLQPDLVLNLLSQRLDLPDIDAMRMQIRRPSRTVSSGTADKVGDVHYLIERWRKKVGPVEEQELMSIPAAFGIDVYTPDRCFAANRYLHGVTKPEAHVV